MTSNKKSTSSDHKKDKESGSHKKDNSASSNKEKDKMPGKDQIKHGFILGLIGGIITVIIGIIVILIEIGKQDLDYFGIGLAIWGIVTGGLIIASSILIRQKEHLKMASLMMLIISILALITMQGLIIGPIISLIGSIMLKHKSS